MTQQSNEQALQLLNDISGNPRLQLTLGDNGANWNPYTIDYEHEGSIPYQDGEDIYSTWNIYDYSQSPPIWYGTITITSNNNQSITWNNYVGGSNGYYLEGVELNWDDRDQAFKLTASSVHQPSNSAGNGPFPDTPRATPAVFNGTSVPIQLNVNQDKIVDNYGREVLLKGVARPSLEWNNQGQYLSEQDFINMKSWGVNTIRLDMNQDFWLNSASADVSGSYKQIIDAMIYYANKYEMATILDLHWIDSTVEQAPMANNDSLTFWQQVSEAYKDFGTVMFEMWNEPYNISQNTWLNGDASAGYVGYQQIYNTIREQAPNNIVLAAGLDWGYDLSFVGPNGYHIDGSNVIYNSHPYDQKGQPGYTGEGGTFDQCYAGILGNYPLFMTEFGDNQAGDYTGNEIYKTIYTNILDYNQQNGVHSSAFAWWVGSPEFPSLISDWSKGTPYESGTYVYNDLQKYPGNQFFTSPANELRVINKVSDKLTMKSGTKTIPMEARLNLRLRLERDSSGFFKQTSSSENKHSEQRNLTDTQKISSPRT